MCGTAGGPPYLLMTASRLLLGASRHLRAPTRIFAKLLLAANQTVNDHAAHRTGQCAATVRREQALLRGVVIPRPAALSSTRSRPTGRSI